MKNVLAVLLLSLLGIALCQDIQFWTSLPNNTASKQLIAGTQYAFSYANKNMFTGLLFGRNVTLTDTANSDSLATNVNYLINQPPNSSFGLLYSSSDQAATVTQNLVRNKTFPFINPLSGLNTLRSFQRNIINLKPSSNDFAYSLVNYSLKALHLQRFGIVYTAAQGEDVLEFIKDLLVSKQGLGLTEFNITANPNVNAAYQEMKDNQVEAVLLWVDTSLASSYAVLSLDRSPDTYLLLNNEITLNYTDSLSGDNDGSARILVMEVYPFWINDYTISKDFADAVATAPLDQARLLNTSGGLEGYFTGRWIASILSRMDPANDTRDDFLNTVYTNQVLKVGGYTIGPLSDTCAGNQLFPCCNQAIHRMDTYGLSFSKGIVTHIYPLTEGTVFWDTCHPEGNSLYPVNFATVYDKNDPIATATIRGIELAFSVANDAQSRSGNRPLQLLKIPISTNSSSQTPFLDATRKLLSIRSNVTSLIGFSEQAAREVMPYIQSGTIYPASNNNNTELTLFDPVSPLQMFRTIDKRYVINLRPSIHDDVVNCLLLIGARNYTRSNGKESVATIALYWEDGDRGTEFNQTVFSVVDDLNRLYDAGVRQLKVSGSDQPRFIYSKIRIGAQLTSLDIEAKGGVESAVTSAFPQSAGTTVDWLLINSRENANKLVDITSKLVRQMNNLGQSGTNFVRMNTILTNSYENRLFGGLTAALQIPGFGMANYPLRNVTSEPNNLFATYRKALSTYYPNTTTISEVELAGYFSGAYASSIVNNIKGEITPKTFFRTIYLPYAQSLTVDSVKAGPFVYTTLNETSLSYSVCNQGAVQAYLYTNNFTDPSLAGWKNVWGTGQDSRVCGLVFDRAIKEEYTGKNQDLTPVIAGSVVVGVFLIACVLILIAVCIAIIAFSFIYYPKSKRKRHLKEPRYELFAIKEKFNEKQNIDAMLIASLPHITNVTKREKLDLLEAFIMKPESIYPVIQGLTKAGLARDDVASCLIYIYTANDQVEALLNYGIKKEISQASHEATLFREDSSLAALWSAYNRLVGLPYLWRVLAETLYDIAQVSGEKHSEDKGLLNAKSLEVDKHRLSTVEERFVNILHLKLAAQTTFNKVRMTPFPTELKVFLKRVRSKMMKNYADLANGVIANFVFLRFICLAVTTPNYFGLWKTSPNEKTLRFLVLMSKVIQNLGFGVEFMKEESMTDMNDFINQNRDTMNAWLEAISTDEGGVESGTYQKIEVSDTLKENCLKWIFSQMYMNRQVLRRELEKKMDSADWKTSVTELEEIGVFKAGGSSDSFSGGLSTLTERENSKRGKISDSHSGSSGQGRYASTEDETDT